MPSLPIIRNLLPKSYAPDTVEGYHGEDAPEDWNWYAERQDQFWESVNLYMSGKLSLEEASWFTWRTFYPSFPTRSTLLGTPRGRLLLDAAATRGRL